MCLKRCLSKQMSHDELTSCLAAHLKKHLAQKYGNQCNTSPLTHFSQCGFSTEKSENGQGSSGPQCLSSPTSLTQPRSEAWCTEEYHYIGLGGITACILVLLLHSRILPTHHILDVRWPHRTGLRDTKDPWMEWMSLTPPYKSSLPPIPRSPSLGGSLNP